MWKTEADKQQGRLRNLFAYFVEYTRIAEIHGIRFLSRRTAFERSETKIELILLIVRKF
jgi:hypothetical protein